MISHNNQAADIIRAKKPNFSPRLGLILGSGLSALANHIENATVIPYHDLPGFAESTVLGHENKLCLGTLQNIPVVCLQGRIHAYEGENHVALQTPIRTLKLLGCNTVVITNIVGALNTSFKPGDLAIISDHINFTFFNPLVGANDSSLGERFPAMENAYDADLRAHIKTTAKQLDINLNDAIYVGTLGPSFETPAEIRAFRLLGADVVGMSAVPEVIIARHCGLRVTVLSVISNMAAGLSSEVLNHEAALACANQAKERLMTLITGSLKNI
jgi:inosine/guanosine/xanthosine phosphorylase family protein